MSVSATAASSIARNEPARSTDTVPKLSFAYISLLLSALFNLFFLLYTICTATSLCILILQYSNSDHDAFDDRYLLGAIVVSLFFDLLYFSLRLHNRAQSPYSTTTYAAYFREKPASLLRLWGRSSHHRRLYFRWQGALRWMVPMDVLALAVCVLPVHVNAQLMQSYVEPSVPKLLEVYHTVLTSMSWSLEAVVILECALEVVRRLFGPTYPNVLMWHPETGSLTPVHPHQYQEAMARHQQQLNSTLPFASAEDQPEYGPPAYGHQDLEDGYTMSQQLPQASYMQQSPHGAHAQYVQQQHYARQPSDQAEGEQRAEGQPRVGKVEGKRANGRVKGAGEDNEGEEGQGEGGELGAATAPLVMMMSPALMDDDNVSAAAMSSPRVMLRVQPSDADSAEEHNPRVASPRYAVVHMSST